MVTTVTPYTDVHNRATTGLGYDGVVRVSANGSYGTGALLFGGRAVLTAAHLFGSGAAGGESADIHFETEAGTRTLASSEVVVHPDYDPFQGNNDLALVWLSSSAPTGAERYELYRTADETGKTLTLVGYGTPGYGSSGVLDDYSGRPLRLKAENSCDGGGESLKDALGWRMAWTPESGTQLVADFDDGTSARDALGGFISQTDRGLGLREGLIAPGDSGGPAFIDGHVAGVASYTASLTQNNFHPDVDDEGNSSFGEIAAWQRVSHYQQWIDQSVRQRYPDAPTTPQEVRKTVAETDSGTAYAYFLLQFTGVREHADQLLSVDFITRDGTAKAGEDYLAASGTLNLYPGEDRAVIPVEVVGDTTPEADETFYLDVLNPVGGSFGAGVVKLTAMRTIVDDDGGWA